MIVRLSIVALLALLLGACSAIQLAYRNADWLIDGWADRYVDFTPAQRERWERDLDQALAAHRRTELPRIVAVLRDAEVAARRDMDQAILRCLAASAEVLFERHGRIAVTLAVPVLADLDSAQIDHLEAAMAEYNQDYREKYLAEDPAERLEDRYDRLRERITRWTGPLEPGQLAMIEGATAAMPDLWAVWFDYRKAQQERLVAQLRAGAHSDDIAALLTAWWVDIGGHPPGPVEAREAVRSRMITLLAGLYRAMDDEQRRRLADNLGVVAANLAELIPDTGQSAAGICSAGLSPAG